ncbi:MULTISPECIES: hypothetical protein [unclassified Methylophaga]|jgi:hypothetical protein|uniref:hypothetical protein n=2 Tax=unclassified Methylophaga TaxID=2629249 RepID=UPI0025D1F8E5|nr:MULTISPECIES: hypothetical protein [unclassified Methylophaga]|tara:strand:- start:4226 stop:4651 length:426 start_codon:yes stop_codon:yes gene_type:complete
MHHSTLLVIYLELLNCIPRALIGAFSVTTEAAMKYQQTLVKLIQFSIVLLMLYPLYYVWETDKIKSACEQINPGMSYSNTLVLLKSFGLDFSQMNGDYAQGEKWQGLVESHASFAGYACEIRGFGDQIAKVRIVKGKQIAP